MLMRNLSYFTDNDVVNDDDDYDDDYDDDDDNCGRLEG